MNTSEIMKVLKIIGMIYLACILITLFGGGALLIIFISLSVISGKSLGDVFSILSTDDFGASIKELFAQITDSLPLGEALTTLFGDSMGFFSVIIDFITDAKEFSLMETWGILCDNILSDIAILSIAHLVFYLYEKILKSFKILKSKIVSFALFYSSVFWVLAILFGATAIISALERNTPAGRHSLMHLAVFICCFGINVVLQAFFRNKGVFCNIMSELFKIGIDVIRSITAWMFITAIVNINTVSDVNLSVYAFLNILWIVFEAAMLFILLGALGWLENTVSEAWLE